MKFYDSEGHCIRDTTDIDFGLNISALDLCDSDSDEECEVIYTSNVSIKRNRAGEGKDNIWVYDPKIPIYHAKSAIETIVDETPNTTTKIVSGLFSEETLAGLIQGDSLEAETLLSVIYPRRASSKQTDVTSPGQSKVPNNLRNGSQVKASSDLHDRRCVDLHYQGSTKNTLSLMEELTLADPNMKHSMFQHSTEHDSGIDCGDGFFMQDDDLQNNVMECNYQILKLKQEVGDLKKKYKIELDRTEDLIKETVNLEKDLRKTLFLDRLLRLLKGTTDKVSFLKWPFKILSKSSESNLIV